MGNRKDTGVVKRSVDVGVTLERGMEFSGPEEIVIERDETEIRQKANTGRARERQPILRSDFDAFGNNPRSMIAYGSSVSKERMKTAACTCFSL